MKYVYFIIAASIIFSSLLILSKHSDSALNKYKDRVKCENKIENVFDEIVSEIKSADSFDFLNSFSVLNDVTVEAKDLCSLINLNFCPMWIIESYIYLNNFDFRIVDIVTEFRNNQKLILDKSLFFDYIDESVFDEHFTLYGYGNFNSLYNFHFDDYVSLNRFLESQDKISKSLFPYFSINPVFNVNSISDDLLKLILFSKEMNLKNPSYKFSVLKSLRREKKINWDDLLNVLQISRSHKLFDLLGTESNVYSLVLSQGTLKVLYAFCFSLNDCVDLSKNRRLFLLHRSVASV